MNSQIFDLRSKNGKERLNELISFLLDCSTDPDSDCEYEIRIGWGDLSGHVIVNWEETPIDKGDGWGGSFKWVEPGDEIYTEVRFPDEHYEMVPKGAEKDTLSEWLSKNPGWELNDIGMWANVEQNRQLAVDLNVPYWIEREESPDDSTFKEHKVSGPIECRSEVIGSVGDDVLRRTGYIVAGPDFIKSPDSEGQCLRLKDESEVRRYADCVPVGDVEFEYEYIDYMRRAAKGKASIPVYIDERCNGILLYITDSNYLIARLKSQCNQGDSEAKAKEEAQ